jgi:nitrate reductase NapE component
VLIPRTTRHGVNTYLLDYHYAVKGEIMHCRTNVQEQTFNALAVGDSFPVIFLANDPDRNRVQSSVEINRRRMDLFIAVAIFLAGFVGGGFILWRDAKRLRAQSENRSPHRPPQHIKTTII